MKTLSYFFIAALVVCLSCSDDEKKVPVKGKLIIDDVSYDMHQLLGQASVASDYSYYNLGAFNKNAKIVADTLTGKGLNFITFEIYREESTNAVPTGTFVNDDSEELYQIEDVYAVIGLDAGEPSGTDFEDFEYAELIISKDGNIYTIIFEGVTETGHEISLTYEGALTKLPDEEEDGGSPAKISKAGRNVSNRWR